MKYLQKESLDKEQNVCSKIVFLNLQIVFQQVIGILMGLDCALFFCKTNKIKNYQNQ